MIVKEMLYGLVFGFISKNDMKLILNFLLSDDLFSNKYVCHAVFFWWIMSVEFVMNLIYKQSCVMS